MSQVFAGDAVIGAVNASVPTTTETALVTGNFISPPFGNAKAVIMGQVTITPGTGTSVMIIRVRRNPNAENLQVGTVAGKAVTGGNLDSLSIVVADTIPDGRPVQYQLTVQQSGASGNGSVTAAGMATFLISG
jgi:hypothetical protein